MTFSYSWSVTEISGHKYFTITILTVWHCDIQMATRVRCGGIRLASFNSPSHKTSH